MSPCTATTQLELLLTGRAEQFDAWVHSPGGRHVAREVYRVCARYARRYARTGQRCSIKLVWELVRYRIREVRARAQSRGVDLAGWGGYALNNSLTAHMARHIIDRRPDWAGLFELRETDRPARKQTVIVIKPGRMIHHEAHEDHEGSGPFRVRPDAHRSPSSVGRHCLAPSEGRDGSPSRPSSPGGQQL